MKPTSIIFLALALLLVVGGLVICSMAKDAAERDGVALFEETENGETYRKQELDSTVNKLELVFTDAEIHIYADTELETSYVEFINFREGLYTIAETSQIVTFDEMPTLNSLLHINSGFSFNGLRGLIHGKVWEKSDKVKSVNIYLAPDNALKILSVSCDSCTVESSEVYDRFDLLIDADKSTALTLEHFRTGSKLQLTAPDVQCAVEDGYFDTLTLDCTTVDFAGSDMYIYYVAGNAESGKIAIANPSDWNNYVFDVKGTQPTMDVNGVTWALPYNTVDPYNENPDFSFIFEAGETEILLTHFDMYAEP